MAPLDRTRMMLVGDIVGLHPDGLGFFLERATPELRRGEIVYGNVEFPITDRGRYDPAKYWQRGRRMRPEDAATLTRAGFHVVSVANNHIMDFGPEGFLHTLDLLDAQGIAHCGGGRNLAEARRPALLERNGVRVAFLAYSSVFLPAFRAMEERPGMAVVRVTTAFAPHPRVFEQPGMPAITLNFPDEDDMEAVRADIRSARANADVVVVSWHWGVSKGHRKRVPYQMECGRACIDAGADLVVGHHPHVLQGVDVYRRGVILYSLANFVFWTGSPPNPNEMDRNSFIAECEIGSDGVRELSLLPLRMNSQGQPEPTPDTGLLDALERDSEEFGTMFRHDNGRLTLRLPG